MAGAAKKTNTRNVVIWMQWVAATVLALLPLNMTSGQGALEDSDIKLVAGQSVIVQAPWPAVRVAVTDPKIANVQVLTPEQVLVQGLQVGRTDLILWNETEQQTWQRKVVVKLDVARISQTLQEMFPTGELTISDSQNVLLVKGLLRKSEQADQLRRFLDSTGLTYVDMTGVAGVHQVQLEVRVAEVSRQSLRSMGINWFATGSDAFIGQRLGSASGGAAVPSIDVGVPAGTPVSSGVPFAFNQTTGATPLVSIIGAFPGSDFEFFLQALAENQYLRLLANPTLVAMSGEQADFLAGGEFPIPVTQGGGGGTSNAVTVEYKEYGVRLSFRPVVLGDGTIRLETRQEVSDITDTGAVVIQGFEVPALIVRRAEAVLELKSGQSFAMAGLLERNGASIVSKIPGLGDIPVLGPLFRSTRYREKETELVIMITASLVEPMAVSPPLPGVMHSVPTDWELYVEGRIEGKEPPRLDPDSAAWMKEIGLDQLKGQGAWDSY
ncbi:type II and III secretion system protein family protein [Planctomycetota bacterium]